MIAFVFVTPGARIAVAAAGDRLLDVAQAAGIGLEGTCGGVMACATCHVVLDADSFARVAPAGAEEEGLLDMVPGARRHSRLACQLRVSPALAGAAIVVPDD